MPRYKMARFRPIPDCTPTCRLGQATHNLYPCLSLMTTLPARLQRTRATSIHGLGRLAQAIPRQTAIKTLKLRSTNILQQTQRVRKRSVRPLCRKLPCQSAKVGGITLSDNNTARASTCLWLHSRPRPVPVSRNRRTDSPALYVSKPSRTLRTGRDMRLVYTAITIENGSAC